MAKTDRLIGLPLALLLVACGGGEDGGDSGTADAGADRQVDGLDGGNNGATACVVFETSQLLCNNAPNGDIFNSIFSCEAGDTCTAPSPYNVDRDAIQCVDTYRYQREEYPATCNEVSDWFNGVRDCLVAWHCSSNEDQAGDWQCNAGSCDCPVGGFCPTPQPPGGGPDVGADLGPDAGADDIGPGDAGAADVPETGNPDMPGDGGPPDDGDSDPPGPPGGG